MKDFIRFIVILVIVLWVSATFAQAQADEPLTVLAAALPDGQGDRAFGTPTFPVDSLCDAMTDGIEHCGPFGRHARFSKGRNKTVVSAIPVLLLPRSPSHISWFVISVNVNAVERMGVRRSTPDRIKKVPNTFKSELDSPTAVITECLVSRVCAPGLRGMEGSEFGGWLLPDRFAVRDRARLDVSGQQAAARSCLAARKVAAADRFYRSAGAFTHPLHAIVRSAFVRQFKHLE